MLILGVTPPERREEVRRRRLPVGLRQDQHGHAHPDAAGLEGRDGRRRHRLDEVRRRRPALRHQPRGRLLRRRPGHVATKTNPNAMHIARRQLASSPTAPCTDDGDVWWEDMTDEPPAHLIDWKGNDWTPESRHAGRPPQRPLHRPGGAVPVDRPRVGGPRGRADLGHPLRRPPRHQRAARDRVASTGSTACSSARSCPRRRPPPPPAPSASCASTPSPCCRSAATTWATTSRTGSRSARPPTPTSCPSSSGSTGSARTTTASSCGPGFGENSRVLKWVVERVDGDGDAGRHAHRPGAHARRHRPRRASTSTTPTMAKILEVDDEAGAAEVAARSRTHFEFIGEQLARRAARRADRRSRSASPADMRRQSGRRRDRPCLHPHPDRGRQGRAGRHEVREHRRRRRRRRRDRPLRRDRPRRGRHRWTSSARWS